MTIYDRIGTTYAQTRQTDPRIAAHVEAALRGARTVINVGAGAGSYEPSSRNVVAVEPSRVMIAQRPSGSASAVQAIAERLPFPDGSFDAAMAVLSIHHWSDPGRGLRELRRVARQRAVVLTWDQAVWESFWLGSYFPAFFERDRQRALPFSTFETAWGTASVQIVPIPWDCRDGFAGAFWRRPAAYLDPAVRAGISTFGMIAGAERERGLERLADDLQSGAWAGQFGHVLGLGELDLGYRLLVWESSSLDG